MGVFEEIVKNKEQLFIKILQILEGKETKTKINLDGVEFNVGDSRISVNGNVEFTIVPFVKKK